MTKKQDTTGKSNEKSTKSNEKLLGGVTGKGFMPGQSGNPNGLTPLTKEEKKMKKVEREIVKEYIKKLTKALPKISPALIKLAKKGDIQAIKEIHDRVLGRPKQNIDLTSGGFSLVSLFESVNKEKNKENNNDKE